MKSGIYFIVNKVNDKKYIGSALTLNTRRNAHFSALRNNAHYNGKLQGSYIKHGHENFEFRIVARCPKEYLIKLEQWFIDSCAPEYNIARVAGSTLGRIATEITRDKIRARALGRKHSEESKRLRIEKQQRKIYQYNLDGIYIGEFASILDAANKIGVGSGTIGLAARRGSGTGGGYQWRFYLTHKLPAAVINQQKPVIAYDANKNQVGIYKNISAAKRELKANNVTACLHGNLKTSGGYSFSYARSC